VLIEHRWGEGRDQRFAEIAAELVRLKVDVIVAPTSIYTAAAKRATSTIPIVFMSHADPVLSGHVASLARPGGNITGLSLMLTEMYPKFLELLKEVVPKLSRVAVLWDPATPSHRPGLDAAMGAARTLRLQMQSVAVRSAAEFDGAFSAMSHERAEGVLILSTPLFIAAAGRLADLALAHRLPTIFGPRVHAEAGGLLSFGPDRTDLFRRAAGYVDRILKGAKPADLPVEQASKFELVINLKTANALGLSIPPSLLQRADQVLE
jgi:putative ABC transport system substrate-binding protein